MALKGQAAWTFDFVLFKKGETKPMGVSLTNRPSPRSVNLEIGLTKGDYVVHVRLDRQLDAHVGFPGSFLEFIDYFFSILYRMRQELPLLKTGTSGNSRGF
jgi:hypothetical protein